MNWTPILINWAFWLVVSVLFVWYWVARTERTLRRRRAEGDAAAAERRRAWEEEVARWDAERAATDARLKALFAEVNAQFDRLEAALADEPGSAPTGAGVAAGPQPAPGGTT